MHEIAIQEDAEMSIKIRNLTKRFEEKLVLDGFSLELPERGIFALVGESGIGKTTLLRLIAGLDKDYSGEIVLDSDFSLSMAFQEHRLFPSLTAIENVVFAVSDGKDKAVFDNARKMLLSLGLTESDLLLYPEQLSGGMKQRISVARALLYDAKILLLDEPTKELDQNNRALLLDMIKSEGERRLVIIATHNEDDVERLCARIVHI